MGFDIANTAAALGAEVILVSGPTHFTVNNTNIMLVRLFLLNKCTMHVINIMIKLMLQLQQQRLLITDRKMFVVRN
jgi:hypothetical protein